jgi:SSS family solute:Na+ symporter
MALLTYYLDPAFQTEIMEGISDPRNQQVADKVFPHYIAHRLPVIASGLVVAALFAVAMSSLDSGVNSVSAVLTIDVIGRLRPTRSRSDELRLAKAISLVVGLVCTILAWIMLNIPEHYNIIGITARTFNCALGPLAALFAAGMFLPRSGQASAIASTLAGLTVAVCSAWWVELIWALGLTQFVTLQAATDHLRGPSPFLITPLAATSAFLLAWLLSLIFPARPRETPTPTWRRVVFEAEDG